MRFGKESEQVEFKKSTSLLKEGIVSLVAMLNKHGRGTLYFGVDDEGTLTGQAIGKDTLRDIAQKISEIIHPQIIPTIRIIHDEETQGIVVEASGSNTPYSCQDKYYIRIADTDRILRPEELKAYFKSKLPTESLTQTVSNNQKPAFTQLKELFLMRGFTLNDETFSDNLGLRTKDKQWNLLAELVSDRNDVSIKVVRFGGIDKSDLIARSEFGNKCLFLASEQVLRYCEAMNETRVELGGRIARKETKRFDFDALREAWLNAVVHNQWTTKTPPAVYWYQNRIEIVSTGGLPPGMNRVEFFSGKSHPVNPELQKIFGQLDMVEQTGHGVPLIVAKYGTECYEITEHFITVTIPLIGAYPTPMVIQEEHDLNPTQNRVLELLRENGAQTIKDLSKRLGLSEIAVKKNLHSLKLTRHIERTGSKRKGYWLVLR